MAPRGGIDRGLRIGVASPGTRVQTGLKLWAMPAKDADAYLATLTVGKPLPPTLIRKLVKARLAELAEARPRSVAKKSRAKTVSGGRAAS